MRALDEALDQAQLTRADLAALRVGVFTGGEKEVTDDLAIARAYDEEGDVAEVATRHLRDLRNRSADRISRMIAEQIPGVIVAANYSMACAASAVAVAQAVHWIRRGRIDCALVVGMDTPVNSGTLHAFELLGALSVQNETPEAASRPFDAARDGFVLSEGAGAVVLLSPEASARRGIASAVAITGVGASNNCSALTKTPAQGGAAARAMQRALDDAGLPPSAVGYINAHGTSTDVGDISESNAIACVFAAPPPVSSTKSMMGHLIAGAGVVEVAVTCLALQRGWLPPTINQQHADRECSLDYIPNRGRAAAISHALTNSFGFGGTNVAILMSKP
jgi:3-oxoacyl-[acyl-carrier-protein] synthase II